MTGERQHPEHHRTATDTVAPVVLGVVVSPQVSSSVREAVVADLPAALCARIPGGRWAVEVVEEQLVVPPADPIDLLEMARDRLLDADWDLAVVLTEVPLRDGRRALVTQASPVHGVGLVSVPALGPVHVRARAQAAVLALVATLVGWDGDAAGRLDAALGQRLRQLSGDTPERPGDTAVQFAARVLGGNVRVLLGMVRANRPWRLTAGLSRALTAAAATGFLFLVTPDLWMLSAAYGPVRLAALTLVSVAAVSLALVLGGGLWERARRRREREQVVLFNAATAATVIVGVLVFYLSLFALSWAGAALLVEAEVYREAVGRALGPSELGKLAWLTATLATVGGALGAGLESDDAVRQAAYTRPGGPVHDEAARVR